ncbi:MAG: hypothetical protein B7Z08_09610 [Sphingomonadales bacterium 32-68-7]|nr:MAG: hypothetical protein B7Z33_06670 [Sphingomonadales bacterium 12-68-11]OYX08418.1 MAG: hypothetical protein B7Z08_09610 [Sphingomonadales bacterium 32-68-7]
MAALFVAAPACSQTAPERPALGLLGTIPIFWGEAAGPAEALAGSADHWARPQLEQTFALRPLDVLDAASLAGLERLLLAQPRALSPAENVALDAWVRGGGHLLLFADPLLTGESRFAIGDRRRPQDVALLSPILARWGLRLTFAEDQQQGFSVRDVAGIPVPLNLPGRFEGDGSCALAGDGVLARCRIGAGEVTVLADAALLDLHERHPAAPAALERLTAAAFAHGPAQDRNYPP